MSAQSRPRGRDVGIVEPYSNTMFAEWIAGAPMQRIAIVLLLAVSATTLGSEGRSFGQAEDLDILSKQFTTLYGQGKYTEAAKIAEQLRKLIEAARGPNDPLTATALNNLGVVYNQEGKYPLAEQAF